MKLYSLLFVLLPLVVTVSAYQPSSIISRRGYSSSSCSRLESNASPDIVAAATEAAGTIKVSSKKSLFRAATFTAATAALSMLLMTADPVWATSKTAAQVSLDSFPPNSVEVNVKDLPLIGDIVSGTYSKVQPGSIKKPSITVVSPKDKISAVKSAITSGHLEIDVVGKIQTHLDVDVTDSGPGYATVKVSSPLIPALPFGSDNSNGGKKSDWSVVTNMGSGEKYYFNSETSETTNTKPKSI